MLTDLQERFCQEYLIDCNPREAARRAGYSVAASSAGYSLLQADHVAERIKVLQAERAEKLKITAEWVLTNLRTIAERCMELEPVLEKTGSQRMTLDAEGDIRPVVQFNSTGALRAFELIGKHLGMFAEKIEHSGSVDAPQFSEIERARRMGFVLENAIRKQQQLDS